MFKQLAGFVNCLRALGKQDHQNEQPASAQTHEPAPVTQILNQYIMSAPSPQNAIDIFEGEWASELPDPSLIAGSITLFDDYRIKWFAEHLGGFQNKTILELGPLEAGHTYMLERLGAA